MSETVISVSDAARNLADYVHQARFQNAEFLLVENGVPFARLVPVEQKAHRGSDLLAALRKASLSPEEATAWWQDIEEGRKMLLPPEDRWE